MSWSFKPQSIWPNDIGTYTMASSAVTPPASARKHGSAHDRVMNTSSSTQHAGLRYGACSLAVEQCVWALFKRVTHRFPFFAARRCGVLAHHQLLAQHVAHLGCWMHLGQPPPQPRHLQQNVSRGRLAWPHHASRQPTTMTNMYWCFGDLQQP